MERGLLTDYKVMVLTVDQGVIAPRLQQELSGVSGELMLDDASKIVGCWNGLAKRSGTGIVAGEPPMRRAVAFAKDIKTSKQVAELFPKVVEAYRELVDDGPGLACSVRHVDGTFNALVRNEQLAWLKGVVAEDECRILSNARCLLRRGRRARAGRGAVPESAQFHRRRGAVGRSGDAQVARQGLRVRHLAGGGARGCRAVCRVGRQQTVPVV
ncbi:hypothetical protein IU12_08520, partial [Mycobacterium tuberculosis]